MPWWLRNEQTRALVQPLPRPVGLPARLRSRAICWSGIKRANSRISDKVSSGTVQRCLPAPLIFRFSAVWSPPCQCRIIWMKPPSMRTTISCSAARKILLRVAAVAAGCDQASSRSVLKLIRAFLKSGVMEDGLVSPVDEGTPQGGPLSPLLSNLVLDDLD